MTSRYHSLTVVFEKDIRDDDAESLLNVIRALDGVLSVSGNITDIHLHVANERVRHDLGRKLWNILYPEVQITSSAHPLSNPDS